MFFRHSIILAIFATLFFSLPTFAEDGIDTQDTTDAAIRNDDNATSLPPSTEKKKESTLNNSTQSHSKHKININKESEEELKNDGVPEEIVQDIMNQRTLKEQEGEPGFKSIAEFKKLAAYKEALKCKQCQKCQKGDKKCRKDSRKCAKENKKCIRNCHKELNNLLKKITVHPSH